MKIPLRIPITEFIYDSDVKGWVRRTHLLTEDNRTMVKVFDMHIRVASVSGLYEKTYLFPSTYRNCKSISQITTIVNHH